MPHAIQVPSPARLLRAWETGRGTPPARQALLVLAACCPDAAPEALAALPVGIRDRLLIAAHRATFGPVYDCVADCSHCGCLLEAELPLDQMLGAGDQDPGGPAASDPASDAELSVQLTCPDCGNGSELALDPVVFLWAELDDWAWRLLGEVHTLASSYGWDEDVILAMSPGRRSAYLSLRSTGGAPGVPMAPGDPITDLAAEPIRGLR
jgi:hypothetical protein